jgi:hypothetical protein
MIFNRHENETDVACISTLLFFSPVQLMAHLGVQENELVLVRNTLLPTATFVKLQPHTTDFLDVSQHKEL